MERAATEVRSVLLIATITTHLLHQLSMRGRCHRRTDRLLSAAVSVLSGSGEPTWTRTGYRIRIVPKCKSRPCGRLGIDWLESSLTSARAPSSSDGLRVSA